MGGKLIFPGGGVYHATKHAVEAISDALRFEVAGFGVDVVVIEPGLIMTAFGDTAVGSIDETERRRPLRQVQRGRREGDRGRLRGPDLQARRRPRDGRGQDREGADRPPAEHALQGDAVGRR